VITISVTQARAKLYQLVDDAAANHEPVQIAGRRNSAVHVSEEDWRSIQETLYLLSIPGMRESIREGLSEPLSKSGKTLECELEARLIGDLEGAYSRRINIQHRLVY